MIYSRELEAQLLGGLIKHPDAYAEIANFVEKDDFHYEVNEVIFSVLSLSLSNSEPINRTLLIAKLKSLGLTFKDNISIDDYIDGLCMNSVSPQILRQTVKELKKVTARRNYHEMARQIADQMKKSGDWEYPEIVSFVDRMVYKQLDAWKNEEDTIDLFDELYDLIEERGNNPIEEVGFSTPYKEFNRMYGGLKSGDVYVLCARPSEGKSSWLNYTGFQMSNNNKLGTNTPCLVIDTEMGQDQAWDVKTRLASSVTAINPWYFSTGNWRKNEWMVDAVRNKKYDLYGGKTFPEIAKSSCLHYKYVTQASTENLVNLIKRWYYTKVGRGNPCIVVYDYIKLSGEKGNDKEYQMIGEKVNRLKELMGKEVSGPLLTAIQLNRQGEYRRGDQNDDSSAIATSDRIMWFSSYVGIFRKKTLEETAEEAYGNQDFGTHKLITLKSRHQGKDAAGHNVFVKKHDGKLTYNFINFDLKYFQVTENSSAEQMYNILKTRDAEEPIVKDKEPKITTSKDRDDDPFK